MNNHTQFELPTKRVQFKLSRAKSSLAPAFHWLGMFAKSTYWLTS